MTGEAVFSTCGLYRYYLTRSWGSGSLCTFIMLNPHKANADITDPTIRRCMGFAKAWGFDGIEAVNLFAVKEGDPSKLKGYTDPVGPDNDEWLRNTIINSEFLLVAWGNHGDIMNRGEEVLKMCNNLEKTIHCLMVNKNGQPKHPLYVSGSAVPMLYSELVLAV